MKHLVRQKMIIGKLRNDLKQDLKMKLNDSKFNMNTNLYFELKCVQIYCKKIGAFYFIRIRFVGMHDVSMLMI